MKNKNNNVLIIILLIVIVFLTGFIIYDKVFSKNVQQLVTDELVKYSLNPVSENFKFTKNLVVDDKVVNIKYKNANLYINGKKSSSFEKSCHPYENHCTPRQMVPIFDVYTYNELLLLNWHDDYEEYNFIEIYDKNGNLLKTINSNEYSKYLNDFSNISISYENDLVFIANQTYFNSNADSFSKIITYNDKYNEIKIADNKYMFLCNEGSTINYDDIVKNSDIVVWGKYSISYKNNTIDIKPIDEMTVKTYYEEAKKLNLNICYYSTDNENK